MPFEINVSQQGRHLFATSERSLTSSENIPLIVNRLHKAFPASEGFEITISEWSKSGKDVTAEFDWRKATMSSNI